MTATSKTFNKESTMNNINHIYECEAGSIKDLVLAETRDHAKTKFVHLTTIQGKKITADVKVKLLVTGCE